MISVLYVDDEPDLLDLGRIFLERHRGFKVETAMSAKIALSMLRQRPFDAIISDYQMPEMNGITFLKKVRSEHGDVPFILFTGKGREEVVIEAINNGADFYLQKGGTPEAQFAELAHKTRQAVNRRMAEIGLKKQTEEIERFFSLSLDLLCIADIDGRFIRLNRAWETVLGYRLEDLEGTKFMDLVHPDDVKSTESAVAQLSEGKSVLNFVNRYRAKDGSYRWIEWRSAPYEGRMIYAAARDITDRKLAEEEIRRLTRLDAEALKLAHVGHWELDIPTQMFIFNDQYYRLHGMTAEDAGGYQVSVEEFEKKYTHPDFAYLVREPMMKALASNDPNFEIQFDGCILRKDGEPRNVTVWFRVERDAQGNIIRFYGANQDITERKRAEQKLQASEARYRRLVEQSFYAIITHRNGKVIYANEAAVKLAGVNGPEDIIGHSLDEFYAPGFESQITAVVQQLYDNPGIVLPLLKENFRRLDGSIIEAEMMATSYIEDGKPTVLVVFQDVTERNLIQRELKESEEKYRTLVESSFDGIAIHQDGMVVYVNRTAVRLLGADDPAVFIGKPAIDIVAPEYRKRARQRIENAPKGSQGLIREKFLRADGTLIDVDVTTTPTTWNGRPAGYVTFRDITAQVRAEEALEKRLIALTQPLEDTGVAFEDLFNIDEIQRLQDEFAKATGVAMLLTCPDGTPITKRSNFCRLCSEFVRSTEAGRTRCQESDSVLGKLHEGGPFVHTCLSAGLWGAGASIVLGGRHIANWLIGQVRNEAQTEEEMRAYARELGVDEDEFIRAFLEVPVMSSEQFRAVAQSLFTLSNQLSTYAYQNVQQARFIAERRRAEEALRESEEKFHELFEVGNEGIFLIDKETGAFMEANKAASEMYGYSHEEILARRTADLSAEPEKTERVVSDLERGSLNVPLRYHRRKDGTVFPVEATIRVFNMKGRPVFVAAVRDISERMRAEDALRQTNKKLNLLSNITRHDILNKIAVLQGYLELDMTSSSDPTMTDHLRRLQRTARDIQEHIEFTRIYQDLGAKEPRWQELDAIMPRDSVPDRISFQTETKGTYVFADPMLEKVFNNLLDNSIRHGSKVSSIKVRTTRSNDGLTVIWEDDGVGIPEEEKERIFEQGYGKNTGFGLFLSREILGITGLGIKETGREGEGARFEIHVPEDKYRLGNAGSNIP